MFFAIPLSIIIWCALATVALEALPRSTRHELARPVRHVLAFLHHGPRPQNWYLRSIPPYNRA
ncbi:hypothetical protein [Novosphingobium cyanobacteriorum]|uniref:Secreted protein n=1 Tax=Novosphingobium cyanobacteriorum TaxID=3024215 RepID=A0ABT6CPL9_9SPHN|nr:hypothetical protein [Novosphingobium cyanobacteriorum]MDF8335163.1 hypothetical protein [Novosphingobium cyanobacteriorum]